MTLGLTIYGAQRNWAFFESVAWGIGALVLTIAVGAVVRKWWVLLAVAGPWIALGYLEATGFVGTSDDWAAEPLLSPPGIVIPLLFVVLPLALGKCLGDGAASLSRARSPGA